MTRDTFLLPLIFALLFLAACGKPAPVCPSGTGTPQYLAVPPEMLSSPTPDPEATPQVIMINGSSILMDKVVEGPLCNDTWSGSVYVACNVQVYPWEESPTFLKDCSLSIAPGTVVYVAAHNNAAYYNGCSCHTGEIAEP
jgi:hypothetical protein